MKNLIALLSVTGSSLMLAACGVIAVPVENRPPVLNKDLIQFSAPFGKFEPYFASVLTWPELGEADMAKLVAKVAKASDQADPYMTRSAVLSRQIRQFEAQWSTLSCAANFGKLEPGDDPDFMNYVNEFKPEAEVNDKENYKACVTNQDVRKKAEPERDKNVQAAAPFLEQITLALDPDPANPKNSKLINGEKTQLSIEQKEDQTLEIHITLGDFLVPGNFPTTDLSDEQKADPAIAGKRMISNVSYNIAFRALQFDVPEVDASGAPTGRHYHFGLERNADHGQAGRFTGEMNLMDGDTLVQHGMARIDAFVPGAL